MNSLRNWRYFVAALLISLALMAAAAWWRETSRHARVAREMRRDEIRTWLRRERDRG